MESLLAKIFATALALSQVTTTPDAVKTQFDRTRDQEEVARLLGAGCTHMRKAFDIEDINLDELIATAMDDPQAMTSENKAFRGINFADLQTAYRQFCKNEKVPVPAVDLGEVIDHYNKAVADLPDHNKLKGLKLPGASVVLDRKGERFAEVFEENQRRQWVPLSDIPEHVQKAFLAAEDKRFYRHQGIDERGLIRAFIGNLAQSGRPQGGSTITQQIVKNLLVGEDLTYDRKIREMIVASRVEHTLSKAEILELYLNSVYLGRGSWGIELAARSYFGKQAKNLTLEEGALLAGLTKGPNYFNPDRHPGRAQERLAYVFSRMQEDEANPGGAAGRPRAACAAGNGRLRAAAARHRLPFRGSGRARGQIGCRHRDDHRQLLHRALDDKSAIAARGRNDAAGGAFALRTQRRARAVRVAGGEAGQGRPARRSGAQSPPRSGRLGSSALASARLPLYDVHWTPAIVVEKPGGKKNEAWRVGLADGRILPLSIDNAAAQRKLALHDVVLVRLTDGRGKAGARAELRVRPMVQGAVVVLENKSGRILAMSGGFSYPLSQLNRTSQAMRQPGSAIKPLSYLAALGKGLQPNTLIEDAPITLPPVGGGRAREQDYWTPKNYDGGGGGVLTLRRALENSRNLATVHLLDGGIEKKPEASLNRLCDLAVEAQIYRECVRYYPFVLGAQPVRPLDLAAFYAAIANEGLRPVPHSVDSIDRDGQTIYRYQQTASGTISSVDRAAFYQLKSMMQGVLARGTANAIAGLSPYVAGKTGTSDDENDAWFVGFTNDVTVAVWLGYDNATGKRRTLGGGATGGGVAVPIFEPIIQAVWKNVAPKTVLAPPSAEAKRQLTCKAIDLESGEVESRGKAFTECLRVNAKGKVVDTQYLLVSHKSAQVKRDREASAKRDRRDDTRGTKSSSSPQFPTGYDGAYAFDNNGRYVYSSDPRRSSTQSVPQRENYQQPDWRMPQRSQPAYSSGYWR